MRGTLRGPGVTWCESPGRHRGGRRTTPATGLAAVGEHDAAVATTGGTEHGG